MKRAFLLFTGTVLLASCSQPAEDVTVYKKQIDSLQTVIANSQVAPAEGGIKTQMMNAVPQGAAASSNPWAQTLDEVLMKKSDADALITAWHTYVGTLPEPTKSKFKKSFSFVMDANILKNHVLTDAANAPTNMVVYIGMKSDGTLTLVYDGAYLKRGATVDKDSLVELLYDKGNDKNYVFEYVLPCPTCNKVGIHVRPVTQASVAATAN
jgi:hypothetical protein